MAGRKLNGEATLGKLRKMLVTGEWVGKTLPSERELSEKIKVSRITARKYLQQLCAEHLLESKPGRGYFLTESTIASIQAPASGGNVVLFLYVNAAGEMALDAMDAAIMNGASTEARRRGLELYSACQEPAQLRQTLQKRWGNDLRGVLLEWARPDIAGHLLESRIPFVVVGADLESLPVTAVVQDNAAGTIQALEALAARGHERIALIVNDIPGAIHPVQRLAGYREFMLRSGREDHGHWIVMAPKDRGDLAVEAFLRLDPRPTALFVTSRGLLKGVWEGLRSAGIRVPEDLSLAVWGEPRPDEVAGGMGGVSHVAWSREEMGRLAMAALEERIRLGRTERMTIRVKTRFVDCGSIRSPART